MTFSFHSDAETEFVAAVDHYESEQEGLGAEFFDEFAAAIKDVLDYPDAWTQLAAGIHRKLLRRFPYGIIYDVRDDAVFILAVAHLHRAPEYWHKRSD